jgi:hypothetical protein
MRLYSSVGGEAAREAATGVPARSAECDKITANFKVLNYLNKKFTAPLNYKEQLQRCDLRSALESETS